MPTNNIQLQYKSRRTCLTNYIGSISCHITLPVINNFGGGHTHTHTRMHTHTQTFTHTEIIDKSNFKSQVHLV